MMNKLSNGLLELGKQLFPEQGRAWWVPSTSTFEGLLKSFSGDGDNRIGTLERFINDSDRTIDSMLPDNPNFSDGTVDPNDNDCNDWERTLGLVQYGVTSALTPTRLERMQAIAAKMAEPGDASPRLSAEYMRDQLLAAGFEVVVYENLSNDSPADVLGTGGVAMLGAFELGEVQLGETWATSGLTIVANHVEEAPDDNFIINPPDYYNVFYIFGIGGYGTFASIPAKRKDEFRQLILKLKGAHLVGVLFVNYT